MSISALTRDDKLIEAMARAIHEGLGGNGWAYTNYGGNEFVSQREYLDRAARNALQTVLDHQATQVPDDSQMPASEAPNGIGVDADGWYSIDSCPMDSLVRLRETESPFREGVGWKFQATPKSVVSYTLRAGGILLPFRPSHWRLIGDYGITD